MEGINAAILIIRGLSVLATVFGVIIVISAFNSYKLNEGCVAGSALPTALFCFIVSATLLIFSNLIGPMLSSSEELVSQRSEYVVYIDGEEVDKDKIDLSLYRIRYDDEKGVIYATPRQDSRVIPMFIPFIR